MAGPTFSQYFPTQVSPHYIQLDPIYYDVYYITLIFHSTYSDSYFNSESEKGKE